MDQIDKVATTHQENVESTKSYVITVLLSWFFGPFAFDRFYLGKIPIAILKLVTFGGLGIWAFIDRYRAIFGSMRDKEGKRLNGYAKYANMGKIAGIILLVLDLLVITFGLFLLFVIITLSPGDITSKPTNTIRTNATDVVADELNRQYELNGAYPRESEFEAFTSGIGFSFDPSGTLENLRYEVTNGCNGQPITEVCDGYILTMPLKNADAYEVRGGGAIE